MIKEGRAHNVATLSGMYKRHHNDSGMEKAVVDTYKVQTVKRMIIDSTLRRKDTPYTDFINGGRTVKKLVPSHENEAF